MKPTLAKLRAAFTKNRVTLGALGVVAVAALAWRARTTQGAADATDSDVSQPAGTSTSPSYYTAGAYDSTATDIYNAIQPQLEELRQIASQIPVPGTETTPAASPSYATGYYRQAGSPHIFYYDDSGKLDYISSTEFKKLGTPKPIDIPINASLWSAPTVGTIPTGTIKK